MSKVLIDRELAERVCHVDNSTRQTARRELRTILAAPSGTPEMPVKAYYHEWTDLEGVRTRSVGLEVRKEFTDAPLILEADALAQIACLEGEIAKRDARIVELHNDASYYASRNEELRAELAAIKAQDPVAFFKEGAPMEGHTDFLRYEKWMDGGLSDGWAPLYAAPVSEAKAQGVVMPERDDRTAYEAFYTDKAKTLPLALGNAPVRYHDGTGQYVNDFALFGWMVWGACLSEVARLNAAPAAPAADAGVNSHD